MMTFSLFQRRPFCIDYDDVLFISATSTFVEIMLTFSLFYSHVHFVDIMMTFFLFYIDVHFVEIMMSFSLFYKDVHICVDNDEVVFI